MLCVPLVDEELTLRILFIVHGNTMEHRGIEGTLSVLLDHWWLVGVEHGCQKSVDVHRFQEGMPGTCMFFRTNQVRSMHEILPAIVVLDTCSKGESIGGWP